MMYFRFYLVASKIAEHTFGTHTTKSCLPQFTGLDGSAQAISA